MIVPAELRVLLFDLDGVLIDSVPAIGTAMGQALAEMGRPPLTVEAVRPLIGPPLEESAAIALGSDDPSLIADFVGRFRAVYRQIFLDKTLPAPALDTVIPELARSYTLLVATSKPEAYAEPLLRHLGVVSHFRAVVGRSLALDHHSKAAVIARALAHVPEVAPAQVLMVGDRRYDVEGAREHGIATIGIRSGTGGEVELREAGAAWIVDGLSELSAWLTSTEPTPPHA